MKETIIVEGKDDIRAVKAAVDCPVIATGGTHFGEKKLAEIRAAQARTGIIVLTDPDYAGQSIREKITKAVPGARHAYLPRALASKDHKAGVEHAKPETIRKALDSVRTESGPKGSLTMADLMTMGLTGSAAAAERRRKAGHRLSIGECNAARFLERLNRYGIQKKDIEEALRSSNGE